MAASIVPGNQLQRDALVRLDLKRRNGDAQVAIADLEVALLKDDLAARLIDDPEGIQFSLDRLIEAAAEMDLILGKGAGLEVPGADHAEPAGLREYLSFPGGDQLVLLLFEVIQFVAEVVPRRNQVTKRLLVAGEIAAGIDHVPGQASGKEHGEEDGRGGDR